MSLERQVCRSFQDAIRFIWRLGGDGVFQLVPCLVCESVCFTGFLHNLQLIYMSDLPCGVSQHSLPLILLFNLFTAVEQGNYGNMLGDHLHIDE